MTEHEWFCLWLSGYLDGINGDLSAKHVANIKQQLAKALKPPAAKPATTKKAPTRTPSKGGSGVR